MKDKNGAPIEIGAEVTVRFRVTAQAGKKLHLETIEAENTLGHKSGFFATPSQVEAAAKSE
jgi:hypothetical protein